jgi:outer membrane protein with beta-barrel domain
MSARLLKGVTLAALGLVLVAAPATAQIKWNLGLGLNLPQADLKDAAKSGFGARGGATFGAPMAPISFRAEAGYDMWKEESTDESFNMISVSGDAIYSLPGVGVKPYILGGINWNQLGNSTSGSESESGIGFNLGAGVNFALGGLGAYVEARYVKVSINDGDADISNVPIIFGLRF